MAAPATIGPSVASHTKGPSVVAPATIGLSVAAPATRTLPCITVSTTQFSWWAHCWKILFCLRSYSNCLSILCVDFQCFWYHKSFQSIFVFLVHQLCLYARKIADVFPSWFYVEVFCIRSFPLLLGLTSFQSMIFSLFFRCITFLLLQIFFLCLLSVSTIHIHAEGWTICRLSECWFWCKFWYFCFWRCNLFWWMFIIVDQINGELFTGFYSGSVLFWSTYEVDHYVSNVTTWI